VVAAFAVSACQTALRPEEAKKLEASFEAPFVPPPRTVVDITAVLDQHKRDIGRVEALRAAAARTPPSTSDPAVLALFYHERAFAFRGLGLVKQELADWGEAARYAQLAGPRPATPEDVRLFRNRLDQRVPMQLAVAEMEHGSINRAIGIYEDFERRFGSSAVLYGFATEAHASRGDLVTAEAVIRKATAVLAEERRTKPPNIVALSTGIVAGGEASVFEINGKLAEAEKARREGIAAMESNENLATSFVLHLHRGRLARVIARQGRLVEAEVEARKALLASLDRFGRYSPYTASILHELASIILAQGRYTDAEALERATLDIYANLGRSEEANVHIARTRRGLASALGAQGRWVDALAEYEAIRRGLQDEELFRRLIESDPDYLRTLLNVGREREAVPLLMKAVKRSTEHSGANSFDTVTYRGLLAIAHTAIGDRLSALREFAAAIPTLSMPSLDIDDDPQTRLDHDRRVGQILNAYVGLLWDVRGTREAGSLDVAAEAFRVADAARSRSVERALDASTARTAAKTPELRDLVRREQDARMQLSALRRLLADVLGRPSDPQQGRFLADLRGRIEALSQAHQTVRRQIERDFPDYSKLLNPLPATIAQVRDSLRPGEALIATFVLRDRTFVWAVPQHGAPAFAAADTSERALAEAVETVRRALAPHVIRIGDIPPFDVVAADKIFRLVLEPVRSGWEGAESLLIVPHGPLGQLPFALLPTKPTPAPVDSGLLFDGYRRVPWLVRTHAVTVLPSPGALATLRSVPVLNRDRRAFVGFGDPLFSNQQAREAAREQPQAVALATAATGEGALAEFRNLRIARRDSSRLSILPRLPDTADEIRAIAATLGADEARDVFLRERANEQTVRTLDLRAYRVIAFATHGLVPGDLDGLTQPALALTAPEVANVPGDGLLTTEKIFGLRLDADWVVLSACNTAGGSGAGSDAISGLGRAFFYAGARALLVTSWPVETTSARALTTDLFRRQQANQRMPRAKALQQTLNALIDDGVRIDKATNRAAYSYAHPIFWAPFSLVGDGG